MIRVKFPSPLRQLQHWLCAWICLCVSSSVTYSSDDFARLSVEKPFRTSILQYSSSDLEVRVLNKNKTKEVFAILEGQLTQPGWNLLVKLNRDWVQTKRNSQGGFRIVLPKAIHGRSIEVMVIGPKGELDKQVLKVFFPAPESHSPSTRAWSLSSGLGITSLAYEQSYVPAFSQIALTPKIALRYQLSPAFDTELSAFGTAATLSSSLNGVSARFIGINLRGGYNFSFLPAPWHLGLMLGGYFTMMIVPENAFGYTPVIYPQIYPVLRRTLSNGGMLYGYLKFVPLSSSNLFSLNDREISAGTGWVINGSSSLPISISLDFSSLQFETAGSRFTVRSGTFGIGTRW